MRVSSAGSVQPSPPQEGSGEQRCLNSELWHACAGPLVSLPAVSSRVVYFPQGHSEQVAASTNKEVVDGHIPNYPNLPPQLICQLHNVTMNADAETDEVYAQMTLQPLNPEQKEPFMPVELGGPSKQPTNYFCKTLTASDTSTHGGFSVPRRAAEKVFPPLDFTQQPPCQELIAKDLHDNEWKFRHIFRGQPKRHLLTTGWSVFVSAKRLVAGDSVIFIWNDNNQLLLGIRRANRPQTVMPSSVLSSDSMHIGLLAAAAHAAATNSRFTIFFNPRASPSEFVIPLAKYVKAVYHTRVSVGMRFRMLFETEESSVRRYMGTITGISDLDPVRWSNSHWRSVKVGWDESTAGERQPRVSLWEIEPLTTFPMYPTSFPLRLKRPWPSGLPSIASSPTSSMLNHPMLNFPRLGPPPWLTAGGFNTSQQQQGMFGGGAQGMKPDVYHAMASAALQEIRSTEALQFQQAQNISSHVNSLIGNGNGQLFQQMQPQFVQTTHHNQLLSGPDESSNITQNFGTNQGVTCGLSPLHGIFRSFSNEEANNLLNISEGWGSKRLAVDTSMLETGQVRQNNMPVSSIPLGVLDQDQQTNLLFGVNIDSNSLLLGGGGNNGFRNGDDSSVPISFMGSDLHQAISTSTNNNCLDDPGFIHTNDEIVNNTTSPSSFVKVYKSGSFGRSLDITKFNSYGELRRELERLFGIEGQLEVNSLVRSGWQLVFVDSENDILLVGDDPWQEFVNSVSCIKILSPGEVQQLGGKEGIDLLHGSAPSKILQNLNGCDVFLARQDSQNMSSGIPSVCSLDY